MASAVAEVSLNHPLLKAGAELVCSPSSQEGDVENIFRACCEDVLPIVLYAIEFDILTEKVGKVLCFVNVKLLLLFRGNGFDYVRAWLSRFTPV